MLLYFYWFGRLDEGDPEEEEAWHLAAWAGREDIPHEPLRPIESVALVPYSIPTCEKYGDIPVRDLAIQGTLNGNSDDFSDLILYAGEPDAEDG